MTKGGERVRETDKRRRESERKGHRGRESKRKGQKAEKE